MSKHRDFDRFRRERSSRRKSVPFSFTFEGETYEFSVKPSFALMETIGSLEEEIAEKTEGDPDLSDPKNAMWVFRKTGDVCETFVGAENWKRLKHSGFEVEDALDLVEWVGNELAEARQAAAEEDGSEDAEEEPKEVSPTDAPGEQSGPKSESPSKTSSPAGPASRPTREGTTDSQPTSFSGSPIENSSPTFPAYPRTQRS